VENNHLPDIMKETILVPIYKKGDPTVLGNYRGIMLTNNILNIALTIEERCLQKWAEERNFLPPFQIATKPNVEGRDITSFLAIIHSQAVSTKEPLYILQKDQQKGFDFLSLQCFYDAVSFYGMPSELVEFDRTSQDKIPCRILTPFGLTDTFTISHVNRQGDTRSPIRFTLSMGMGSWHLHEVAQKTAETLSLETSVTIETTAARKSLPHTCTDAGGVTVTSAYMMDDSLHFAGSLSALAYLHEHDERFGTTYGVKTATGPGKSSITIINPPKEEELQEIRLRILKGIEWNGREWGEEWESEGLPVQERITFLKMAINRPEENFE